MPSMWGTHLTTSFLVYHWFSTFFLSNFVRKLSSGKNDLSYFCHELVSLRTNWNAISFLKQSLISFTTRSICVLSLNTHNIFSKLLSELSIFIIFIVFFSVNLRCSNNKLWESLSFWVWWTWVLNIMGFFENRYLHK